MNKTYHLWPRWYRGDFHAHTAHSDGVLTPIELLAEARLRRLDFFAITDHNLATAYAEFGDPDDILILPGIEVTMQYGHFNVFGLPASPPEWVQSLPVTPAEYAHHLESGAAAHTPNDLMRLTRSQRLYNSINHPLLGDWAWRDTSTDLRLVDFLEIWNDPTWPANHEANHAAVNLWTQWLNAGHRITAIGGTDFHDPQPQAQKDGSMTNGHQLDRPTTYVYANELSGNGLLSALKRRRAYVTMGPQVAFGATIGAQTAMIGDDLGPTAGKLTLQTTVRGAGKLTVQLIRNGTPIGVARGQDVVQLWMPVEISAEQPQWFRVDVRDHNDHLIAVTNPIFCGPHTAPTHNLFSDF